MLHAVEHSNGKSAEEARYLIEDLAKCNMKAPSEFQDQLAEEEESWR